MLELAARLALTGELRVLDGGNRFNVYPVARIIRRYSPELTAALARIRLARAFTCYQAAAMLAEMPAETAPAAGDRPAGHLLRREREPEREPPPAGRLHSASPAAQPGRPGGGQRQTARPHQRRTRCAGGSPADRPPRVPGSWNRCPCPKRPRCGTWEPEHGTHAAFHHPGISCRSRRPSARFRRALRRADQLALDDLFASARQHLAAAAYAAHALPMETFLLSMLLEQHKEVLRLRR